MVDADPTTHSAQSSSPLVGHAMHPGNALNLPAPHCRHTLIPTNEYTPAGHRLQLTLRATGLKLPGSHCGQLEGRPSADEYRPGWQSWQVELATAPDDVENVPCWQSVQAWEVKAPVLDWNVPAWQSVQFAVLEAASPVEYVPAWQEKQLADVVAPAMVLYFPGGQFSQFTPDQLGGGCN
jgi:hypothetical protein